MTTAGDPPSNGDGAQGPASAAALPSGARAPASRVARTNSFTSSQLDDYSAIHLMDVGEDGTVEMSIPGLLPGSRAGSGGSSLLPRSAEEEEDDDDDLDSVDEALALADRALGMAAAAETQKQAKDLEKEKEALAQKKAELAKKKAALLAGGALASAAVAVSASASASASSQQEAEEDGAEENDAGRGAASAAAGDDNDDEERNLDDAFLDEDEEAEVVSSSSSASSETEVQLEEESVAATETIDLTETQLRASGARKVDLDDMSDDSATDLGTDIGTDIGTDLSAGTDATGKMVNAPSPRVRSRKSSAAAAASSSAAKTLDEGGTYDKSEAMEEDFDNEVDKKRRRRNWKIFAAVLILVGIGAAVGGIMFARSSAKDRDANAAGNNEGSNSVNSDRDGSQGNDGQGAPGGAVADGPTADPTLAPTGEPTTASPTSSPTYAPALTPRPTDTPTLRPTGEPSVDPTPTPTSTPTFNPTSLPTAAPTSNPTFSPTPRPTAGPTPNPTPTPTDKPTSQAPTQAPTPNIWTTEPIPFNGDPAALAEEGYFNYDPNDNVYGPSSWGQLVYRGPPPTGKPTAAPTGNLVGAALAARDTFIGDVDGLQAWPGDAGNRAGDPAAGNAAKATPAPTPMPTQAGRPGLENAPEYLRWSPIQHVVQRDLTENKCDSDDPSSPEYSPRTTQSPIDVRLDNILGYSRSFNPDGSIEHNLPESGQDTDNDGDTDEWESGVCYEHHEIRRQAGSFRIRNSKVEKQILPNKLRLAYPFQEDYGTSPNPSADFPHQWGGRIDVRHVDVSVPSMHLMEGRRFPAEYQIWHLHKSRGKSPVVAIFMDLHPEDKPNQHLQKMLDEFQKVWESDYFDCENRRRMERRAEATFLESIRYWISGRDAASEEGEEERRYLQTVATSTILDEPPEEEEKFQALRSGAHAARQAQSRDDGIWSPHDRDEIMTGIHFYGYTGSLSEPPCSEFAEYRVMDTPMLISRSQLFQIKFLIFRHIDGNCRRTSSHHEGSAVRPIQPLRPRHRLYRCTCNDFLADAVNATRCSKNEEQEQLKETLEKYGV